MIEHLWKKNDANSKAEMAHLLLTGRISSENFVRVHTNWNRLMDEHLPRVKVTRDLDSFLAVSKCLPYRHELSIRFIPRPQDCLKKNVHICVATPKVLKTYMHLFSKLILYPECPNPTSSSYQLGILILWPPLPCSHRIPKPWTWKQHYQVSRNLLWSCHIPSCKIVCTITNGWVA